MRYIKRAIEDILVNRVKNAKCLLLTGARQVGKSTILKKIYSKYTYVSFDDEEQRRQIADDVNLFFLNNKPPIIIDEVQKQINIFEKIKLMVDSSDERGNFILSGSQKLHLLKSVSESLSGRISILNLSTLSMRECLDIDFNKHFIPTDEYIDEREKKLKSVEDVWDYIHKGMYPELYSTEREWEDFYTSYVNTYLERDINSIINVDSVVFLKFLIAIAARTGEVLNYRNIANEVGVSEPTIKAWISILERTDIIYLLEPYSTSALSRAIKSPKVYFKDTGLVCYLTKWASKDTVKVSQVNGNIFETFVVSEIIKSFSNEGKDYRFSLFYYRGKDKNKYDNEIDLIIEENGILYPIEIKMSATPKSEMAKANDVLDKIEGKNRGIGVILCQCDKKVYLRDNLIALPIEYI